MNETAAKGIDTMNTTDGFLNELDRLSKQPSTMLNREYWFPLALFGALSIGGALVFSKWDPADTSSWVWWAVFGPLGGVATSGWFRSRSVAIGVITTAPPAVYVTLGALCAVGCAITGALVTDPWTYPLIMGIVGMLNVALGLVDRSELMVAVGLALIAMGTLAGAGDISAPLFSLIVGVFMLGAAGAHLALR